ncbi:MAG TPA: TIM barrel protein [Vicinamibacterales bacterium]|jgi:sugar phosphate isomerase/epimerase
MTDLHTAGFRYSRRDFARLALAAFPAAAMAGRVKDVWANQSSGKPDSLWGGVPFGIFAPYRFGPDASDLEGALAALVKFGVSYAEVTAAVVERHVGAPQAAGGRGGAPATPAAANAAPPLAPAPMAIPCEGGVPTGAPAAPGGGGRGQSPEQQAAARAQADALAKWRATVAMDKFVDVRGTFDAAGVHVYAYRITLTSDMADSDYDYAFNAAKALGASQITMEHPHDAGLARRIGQAGEKHGVNIGYHLHTTASMTAWDDVLAASPRNGLQLDIGHYVAGTGQSPVPLIEKLHSRIYSMHLKDRKKLCHDRSENMPWGDGDTPIRDVLQTLKKHRWAIPVGIEFEYLVPPGSTWDAEIAKCVSYGKQALLAGGTAP